MAEQKRIQLDAPKTLHREKKQKALPPTYRFELELTDTKNIDCAEYSYAELVKEARVSTSRLSGLRSCFRWLALNALKTCYACFVTA